MQGLRNRYYAWFFAGITVLVLAQVSWWAWTFLGQTSEIAALRSMNLFLQSQEESMEPPYEALQAIEREAARRRLMFISESSFFALLTVWALYLLYRGLRREEIAQNLQKSFIEVVSHESKTPLTALKLRLEDLRDEMPAESPVRRELNGSLEEVRRLITTFEKMLTLHRTERHALYLQAVSFNEVIGSVTRRLGPFLKNQHATIEIQSCPVAYVLADKAGLETSLQCLVENSVLHNPKSDRRVWLEVQAKDRNWILRVRDNGPGVSEGDRNAIFDKFSRGSRSNLVPGTGLGLYIARKIAEAHQGALRLVESSANGTLFELEIPAVRA